MEQNGNFPHDELHAALDGDHPGRASFDAIARELGEQQPRGDVIATHVNHLRSIPEVGAIIANWWEDPITQRFIANLNAAGL